MSYYGGRRVEESRNGWKIGCGVLTVLGLIAMILLRNWEPVHWFVRDVLYMNWFAWFMLVVIFVLWIIPFSMENRDDASHWKSSILLSMLLVAWLFVICIAPDLKGQYLVQNLQVKKIESPLEVPLNPPRIRYQPMEVAQAFASKTFQSSSLKLGDPDPIDNGQEFVWWMPMIPNGLINSWSRHTEGIKILSSDGSMREITQSMKYGEGNEFGLSVYWQARIKRYFSKTPEVYYLQVDGEVLTMMPYVRYRFILPSMIPYWGGVLVFHPDGEIEDLSPKEARMDPRFVGQRLFPEALAQSIGYWWGHRNGAWNAVISHNDQAELPEIKNSANQLPYLLATNDGPQWFSPLEPSGKNSEGVFKLLYINAHDGLDNIQIVEYERQTNLTGPNSAFDFLKSAYPLVSWTEGGKGTSGSIIALEPRPVFVNGILHWMLTITSNDYTGISWTNMLNANDNSIYECTSISQVREFAGGNIASCKMVQSSQKGNVTTSEQTPTEPGPEVDIDKMSDKDLTILLKRIADEFARRASQVKQSIANAFGFEQK